MIKKIVDKVWDLIKKFTNRETVMYLIFGVLTTIADWITYLKLEPTGLSASTRSSLSWCVAVLLAFITNKIFVFESMNFKAEFVLKEFISFVSSRLATLAFTWLGTFIFAEKLGINDWFVKAVLMCIVIILNYILSKVFIFNKKSQD